MGLALGCAVVFPAVFTTLGTTCWALTGHSIYQSTSSALSIFMVVFLCTVSRDCVMFATSPLLFSFFYVGLAVDLS